MIDWFTNNYQWLFSGLGVTVLLFFINRKRNNKTSQQNGSAVNNNITINNNSLSEKKDSQQSEHPAMSNMVSVKDIVRILFIDDEKFNVVNILKDAGWKNVVYKKDIINLQDKDVLSSHIIFVDINGVATKLFNDHGLGLANALKSNYPDKKIILYSAENRGNIFNKTLRKVDECLSKNADPYEFINLVEEFSSQIKL